MLYWYWYNYQPLRSVFNLHHHSFHAEPEPVFFQKSTFCFMYIRIRIFCCGDSSTAREQQNITDSSQLFFKSSIPVGSCFGSCVSKKQNTYFIIPVSCSFSFESDSLLSFLLRPDSGRSDRRTCGGQDTFITWAFTTAHFTTPPTAGKKSNSEWDNKWKH